MSVIVPAHNEAKVIEKTIHSLLAQEYTGVLDVVVVDDGSPDGTGAVARAAFDGDARVTVFTKSNGGKASALNYGIQRASGEIVICLDADTVFEPRTIFSHDTLAEDQDLTIELRKRGWRIAYADRAIAWTEAPDTFATLLRQRFRWSFGTLQCAWKHRATVLRAKYGSLGLVAMPNTVLFQLFFTAISPLADLLFVFSVLSVSVTYLEHGATFAWHTGIQLAAIYLAFLLMDWLAAVIAFLLEPDEERRLTWLILIQRFAYRQIMYWVVVKSFIAAARGGLVGWGTLERKGTVAALQGRVTESAVEGT